MSRFAGNRPRSLWGDVDTMRFHALLLAACLVPTVALAGLDPDPDIFGVYFDNSGNTNSITAPAFAPFTAYLVLMHPAGPTSGCEFSVTRTGAGHFVLSTSCACDMVDGCAIEGDDYWIVCGSDFPVPPSGAVVLVTWSIMLTEYSALFFYIGPSSIPSLPGGLPVLTGNGVLRLGGVASGDISLPVASVNRPPPLSEDSSTFGGVKSLFR